MDIPAIIILFVVFLVIYFPLAKWLSLWFAQKRMEKTVMKMAKDQEVIGGQLIEYWLDILNLNAERTVGMTYAKVLMYGEYSYFFVSGSLGIFIPNFPRVENLSRKAFFLIAIGSPAVQVLANQEHLFRRISGSDELAAFSIYRWSEFTDALIRKGHSKPVS